MKKEEIDILLACRTAIDAHRTRSREKESSEEHTASLQKVLDILSSLGFASIAEFEQFNRRLNLEAYKESHPISGSCDGCDGLPTPVCVAKFGEKACAHKMPAEPTDEMYRISRANTKKTDGAKFSGNTLRTFCPEGHGFYLDRKTITEPAFDINWSVFP